jgi:hypothetical protein
LRLLTLLFTLALARPATAQMPATSPPDFWTQQLAYARVQAAHARCWPTLVAQLRAQHLSPARLEVFFRLLKTSRALEVWARN